MAVAPGGGYWILFSDGTIQAGRIASLGQPAAVTLQPGEQWTSIAANLAGSRYWTFTNSAESRPSARLRTSVISSRSA